MLSSGRFFYGAEVVSTRGLEPVDSQGNLASFARDLLADPRIGWISLTDNPGGGPMLPPDWLAGLVAEHRARVVLHLTCKDMNRNGLEAAACATPPKASTTSWPSPAITRPAATAAGPSRSSISTRSI